MKVSSRPDILERVVATISNALIAQLHHPAGTSRSFYKMVREFRELQDLSNRQLWNVTRYVIGKKYVRIKKNASGARIELTESGHKVSRRAALHALQPQKQTRWDRKFRIVLFDIPNGQKRGRDAFAGCLKRLGFVPLQKSAFVHVYPCEEEIGVVADYYGIADYVELIVAETISSRVRVARMFGLG